MKIRKTLIFPFENERSDCLSKHSMLYRAAKWLESTMRALQYQRKTEQTRNNTLQQKENRPQSSKRPSPYKRNLTKNRRFKPIRRRLQARSNRKIHRQPFR